MENDDDRLEKMLADFESTHSVEGKALRQMLGNTPELKARVLQAVEARQVSGFAPHPEEGMGSYEPKTGKVRLPMDVLGSAKMDDPRNSDANTTRIILGHEIGHAINKADIEKTDKTFDDRIAEIAKSPSPHDYTQALKERGEVQRIRESKDEISGINTLADYIKHGHPDATLEDLYNASTEMKSYITMEGESPDVTYKARDGLSFGNDLKIDASNPKNVEAVGKLFYDERGYPQTYGTYGLGKIADAEEKAQLADPTRAQPEVRVDLKSLGIDQSKVPPEWMPNGFRDTSVTPPAPRHEADPGKTEPGPADRALNDKIRNGVAEAEKGLGKGWDDNSERMTASLTLLAKQKDFNGRDDLSVAFNKPTADHQGGELAFVYRSGPTASPDPYANRAQMPTDEAIARPAQETYQQLQQHNQQTEAQRQMQEQSLQTQIQATSAPSLLR